MRRKEQASSVTIADDAIALLNSDLPLDDMLSRMERLATKLLPTDRLIPEVYSQWRPIVRNALAYITVNLSRARLKQKLVALIRDLDEPLEKRVLTFISEMPTLQKLGQIIARNRNIDPAFRRELVLLENSIRDVDASVIFDLIHARLGSRFDQYAVRCESLVHAEASVSAVVRFSYFDSAESRRRQGVFKVIKPSIAGHFWEEISILDGLARHLRQRCASGPLQDFDLHRVVDAIRQHLTPELDCRNEQAHLAAARSYFQNVPDIRIPILIPELCEETITAMSFEPGVKVTDAFRSRPLERQRVARCLIETLIAKPLLDPDDDALIHADPHAGNLFVDETTGRVVLFDWALVERIDRETRRQIVRLVFATSMRDERMTIDAVDALSLSPVKNRPVLLERAREEAQKAFATQSCFPTFGVRSAVNLIDALMLRGIDFSPQLLVFRKSFHTLEGVIADLDERVNVANILFNRLQSESFSRLLGSFGMPSPLRPSDLLDISLDLQWFAPRLQLQLAKQVFTTP